MTAVGRAMKDIKRIVVFPILVVLFLFVILGVLAAVTGEILLHWTETP